MTVTALYEVPLGVCTQDPDRWTTTPDDEAKTPLRPPGFDDGRRD